MNFSSEHNTATFSAPNIGNAYSHIHYGTTGDWFIRSASSIGKVVLQDSGGDVGIGTGSPAAKLHVFDNDNTVGLIDSSSTTGTWFGLTNRTGARWSLVSTGTGNGEGAGKLLFHFTLNGIGFNRMTLDGAGNLTTSGTVNGLSDRNAKENFETVDPQEVLEKVAGLPISRWNYKTEANVTHLGPMAQDFHAAFQVGLDEKTMSMVDADGVALAAIQGLNQKVKKKESEIHHLQKQNEKLEKQNQTLEQRLSNLEELVRTLSDRN
jgi:hypothetical protein